MRRTGARPRFRDSPPPLDIEEHGSARGLPGLSRDRAGRLPAHGRGLWPGPPRVRSLGQEGCPRRGRGERACLSRRRARARSRPGDARAPPRGAPRALPLPRRRGPHRLRPDGADRGAEDPAEDPARPLSGAGGHAPRRARPRARAARSVSTCAGERTRGIFRGVLGATIRSVGSEAMRPSAARKR